MKRIWITLLLILFTCRAAAHAQAAAGGTKLSDDDVYELSVAMASGRPPAACIEKIKADATVAVSETKPLLLENHISFFGDELCTTWLLLSSDQFKAAVKGNRLHAETLAEGEIEKLAEKKLKAVAQQNGSSAGTGGSTNLTSKALTSKVLSIASEYGALTQTTSGQTTTAQGSFAGVPLVLLGKGLLVDCKTQIFAVTPCVHHKFVEQLSNFSYSVSFENNPNSTTATGTAVGAGTSTTVQQVKVAANSRSINAFSVKWSYNQKPTTADLATAIANVQKSTQADAIDAAITKMSGIQINAGKSYVDWKNAQGAVLYAAAQADHSGIQAEKSWEALADGFAAVLGAKAGIDPKTAATSPVLLAAAELGQAYESYLGEEESAADSLVRVPVFSIEYDDNRPASQPSNSVIRGIFQMKTKPLTVTANGAVSFYNSDQSDVPGATRLRDVQFAAEGAHPFNVKTPLSSGVAATLSGAFYYQYQSSPAILNVTPGTPVDGVVFTGLPATATKIYAEKGNIAIGQIKLTIGGGSSVTVPLSVTYSNRTELVTNPTWKAQIGVSYDFDSLFSAVK